MKTILALLLALSACGDDMAIAPDAAVCDAGRHADSPSGIPPLETGGCAVGNLPNSRTITINTGDPIPPALLNEMQDQIVAAGRKTFTRTFCPVFTDASAGGGAGFAPNLTYNANNPANASFMFVYKTTGIFVGLAEIPRDSGDILSKIELEVYGDGAVDASLSVLYAANMHSVAAPLTGTTTMNNVPASWGSLSTSPPAQILVDGSTAKVFISVNATNFYFGPIRATFSR